MKIACCLLPLVSLLASVALACPAEMKADNPERGMVGVSSLYIKVELNKSVKISSLKTGDVVEGTLVQPVYSGDRELFPLGSRVSLVVARVERRRKPANDHWPWVVRMFTPRHENYPLFDSATVLLPTGKEVSLNASLLSIVHAKEIHADAHASPAPKTTDLIATLEATETISAPEANSASWKNSMTLSAGTRAKVVLLGNLSASKSRTGDMFQARLVEPVYVGESVALPEGTLLEGKVERNQPPRWLSRAGSLLVTFTGLKLPDGTHPRPIMASISGAEIDQRSHTKIDPEGQFRGERPGKLWMVVNAGVTAGIAKEVDDGTQLAIEAIISTATDVSTAGTARIVGLCASSVFMLARHGRDVVLPKFSELEVTFDRPVQLGE
jgi:hypothetical protein